MTDITEHPTVEGKVYCAAVMDTYSRLIVGWPIAEHMRPLALMSLASTFQAHLCASRSFQSSAPHHSMQSVNSSYCIGLVLL